jgi:hypothetical protein
MIPEHLTRYCHPRFDVLDLLEDIRRYADPIGTWDVEQYRHELRRIFNTANAAVEMLGGERLADKPYA